MRNGDGYPKEPRRRGTGVGADAEIKFITPTLAQSINRSVAGVAVKSAWTEGHDPNTLAFEDEILVHELVHAVRGMAGLRTGRRVRRQPHYGNTGEFYAIVVANIYRSECGRGGVRNDNHSEWAIMYVGGRDFLKIQLNRSDLRRFRRQHPLFVKSLHAIDTYFNPFRHMLG